MFTRKCVLLLAAAAVAGCGPVRGPSTSPGSSSQGACQSGPTSVSLSYFLENPRTSSGDNALPFDAPLSAAMAVPGRLSGLEGNCLLRSSRFSVDFDDIFPNRIARIFSSRLELSPSEPEFAQLNAFFYAQKLQDLLVNSLGADLGPSRFTINAHCAFADNAYFNPLSRELCFGYHEHDRATVWAAEDADVVVHESGHSVNHSLAGTDILGSSGEAGALDEGLADYWAISVNGNPCLSEWFLGSIAPAQIRDASANLSYPADLVSEKHSDGRLVAEVLWELRAPVNLGKPLTDALVKRALQLLPASTRFADFYQAIYDASGPGFLGLSPDQRSLILSRFQAHGFHRVDSAVGLRIPSAGASPLVILDDHTYSFQSGGNCNGRLDAGETALVLVNLENSSASSLGVGMSEISAASPGLRIPAGGEVGEFFRMNAASDFLSSLPAEPANRRRAVLMAGFVVSAIAPGAQDISVTFHPSYSDPTGALRPEPDAVLKVSLPVETGATLNNCSNPSLWP